MTYVWKCFSFFLFFFTLVTHLWLRSTSLLERLKPFLSVGLFCDLDWAEQIPYLCLKSLEMSKQEWPLTFCLTVYGVGHSPSTWKVVEPMFSTGWMALSIWGSYSPKQYESLLVYLEVLHFSSILSKHLQAGIQNWWYLREERWEKACPYPRYEALQILVIVTVVPSLQLPLEKYSLDSTVRLNLSST